MYLITWITIHLPTLRDGWLSWPCWLTDNGRLNRKVVIHPASSLAQDRESSPAENSVLTTMLRRQRTVLSTQCSQKKTRTNICLYSASKVTTVTIHTYIHVHTYSDIMAHVKKELKRKKEKEKHTRMTLNIFDYY